MKTQKWLLALIWAIGIIGIFFDLWSRAARGLLALGDALWIFVFVSLGVIGTLIVTRQPSNPVGWTFLAAFSFSIMDGHVEASMPLYLHRILETSPGSATTLGFIDAYFDIASVSVWFSLLIFPVLYFPNGQLPSPRWRYFPRVAGALLLLKLVGDMFHPDLSSALFPDFRNPLSIPLVGTIVGMVELVLIFASVITPLSLVMRFRRARGVERQQIKWPLFSALLATIGIGWVIIAGVVLGVDMGEPPPPGETPRLLAVGLLLEVLSVVTFPFSIGIGILRYRLYDIDLLINRTLVYGILTALLALAYYGGALVLQGVFTAVSGQQSPIALVLSTLAIAALFAPLRRRVQDFIDRRFYRKKYDAAKVLAAFSATVRDETDLDRLTERLVAVVQETMQPAHVSLWLRPTKDEGRKTEVVVVGRRPPGENQ